LRYATVARIVVTGLRGAVRNPVVLADVQVEKRPAGEAEPAQRAGGVERHGHLVLLSMPDDNGWLKFNCIACVNRV
jgi:hypothetical protein